MDNPFVLYDLLRGERSLSIRLLFPGWEDGESVVFLSPHDDDALLGAGYLMEAVRAAGGRVYLVIYCDGSAGYSDPAIAPDIIRVRREETARAYREMGLLPERIIRFDYPDYSILPSIGWTVPSGKGTAEALISALRRIEATRVLVPNGYREHLDHKAVSWGALFDIPQAGDGVKPEWGSPVKVRTVLEYSVWGDFHPLPEAGEYALSVTGSLEERVRRAIGAFRSQSAVMEGLVRSREGRRVGDRYIEVYRRIEPRPALDLSRYRRRVREIDKEG